MNIIRGIATQRHAEELLVLQAQQHRHDENFHRDIAALSLHPRLSHMALHFAKYTGKIARTQDIDELISIFTDVLIIALSTANVVNVELATYLPQINTTDDASLPEMARLFRNIYFAGIGTYTTHQQIVLRAALASGQIAGACEKIDHLEDVPFKREIIEGAAHYAVLAFIFMARYSVDPGEAVRERWVEIEKKQKFSVMEVA